MPAVSSGRETRVRLYLPHTAGTTTITFDASVADSAALLEDIFYTNYSILTFCTIDDGVTWYAAIEYGIYPA
jgi:hypothetical protein